ncbi:SLAP domain-containing protein [Companilactobacillus jidongensis]|uniref:SLAP domain-containing protein n=1 Tax=Companilactobacillus jidongensis TaxID=2486006 RepID=UPI000F772659|nr:SLAP domain-containing protein [Companilactobacillus jidongensis]
MRFQQLKRDPNAVVRKKLYKSGKNWAVKATLAFAGGIMLIGGSSLVVKADPIPAIQSGSVDTPSDGNVTPAVEHGTDVSNVAQVPAQTGATQPVTTQPVTVATKATDDTPVTNYIHYLKPDGTPFLKDDGSPVIQTAVAPVGTKYSPAGLSRIVGHVVPGYSDYSVTDVPYTDIGGNGYVIIGADGSSCNVTVPEVSGNEKLNISEQNEDGTDANGTNSNKQIEVPVNEVIDSPYNADDYVSGRTLDLDTSTVQVVRNDGSNADYMYSFNGLMVSNGEWDYGLKTNLNEFVSSYLEYIRQPGQANDDDGLNTINMIARYKDDTLSDDKVKFIVEFDDADDGHVVYTTPEDQPFAGLAGTVPNVVYGDDHDVRNKVQSLKPLDYDSRYKTVPGYTNNTVIFRNRLTDDTENIQTYHVYVQKLKPARLEFHAIDENGKLLYSKVFTKELYTTGFDHAYTYDGNGKLLSSKEINPITNLYNKDDGTINASEMAEFKKNYFYDEWITNRKLDLDNPRSAEWYAYGNPRVYNGSLEDLYGSDITLDSLMDEYSDHISAGDDYRADSATYVDLVYDTPSNPSSSGSSSSGEDVDDDTGTTVKKNQTVATTTKIVSLFDKNGELVTNRALGINTGWYSDEEYTLDGVMYYRVSTNEFAKSSDVYVYIAQDPTFVRVYNNENGDLINYADSALNRSLKPSSEWRTDRIAIIDGQDYYRVATNEFVPVGEVYEYSYSDINVTTDSVTPVYDERGVKLNVTLPANATYKVDRVVTINGVKYYRVATNQFIKAN